MSASLDGFATTPMTARAPAAAKRAQLRDQVLGRLSREMRRRWHPADAIRSVAGGAGSRLDAAGRRVAAPGGGGEPRAEGDERDQGGASARAPPPGDARPHIPSYVMR